MQDWKTNKLSEAFEIIGGGTPKTSIEEYWNGNIPWLSVVDFNNDQRTVYKTEKTITQLGLQKSSTKLLKKGQLIISARGTVGQIAQLGMDMTFNQSCYGLTGKDNILINDYGYYVLKYSVSSIQSNAHGSVFDTITRNTFDNIEIKLPPLKEQIAIASILSALDDKIELNLQMNKTLEEMAMALYKHWFVDFGPFQNGKFIDSELGMIPEGWEVMQFSNIYELKKGLSYKSKFYSEDGLPMINLKCFDRNGGFREDGIKYYAGDYKQGNVVKPGDLMIAMTDLTQDRAVLGSPIICPEINSGTDVIASLDVGILNQNKVYPQNLNLYFNYKMRTLTYHQYILGYGNGSTVMHLDKKGVLEYNSIIPCAKVIKDFNQIVDKYRALMTKNIQQIKTLTTVRDTILPKLISGEVRVKDVQHLVEESL